MVDLVGRYIFVLKKTRVRPGSNVEFYMRRIKQQQLSAWEMRRMNQISSVLLILVDSNVIFE